MQLAAALRHALRGASWLPAGLRTACPGQETQTPTLSYNSLEVIIYSRGELTATSDVSQPSSSRLTER